MSCQTCEVILLAKGPSCEVRGCTCGVVHFTSGGLSIRLTAESFLGIACTVEKAAMKLVDDYDARSAGKTDNGAMH